MLLYRCRTICTYEAIESMWSLSGACHRRYACVSSSDRHACRDVTHEPHRQCDVAIALAVRNPNAS